MIQIPDDIAKIIRDFDIATPGWRQPTNQKPIEIQIPLPKPPDIPPDFDR